MLDNRYALLFIRGERPIKDLKYDILKHPNVDYTADGKEEVYVHGIATNVDASISFELATEEIKEATNNVETSYELLTSEEIDEMFKEDDNNDKK